MAWVTVPSIFKQPRRVKQPATEPVGLADVKKHLRIMDDFNDDDLYLMGLVAAARVMTENRTRRTFVATKWRADFDRWDACGCRGHALPYPPALVTGDKMPSVGYVDENGVNTPTPPGTVTINTNCFPGEASLHEAIESACCGSEGWIEWWAGVEDPRDVPQQAKVAIMMLVAHWYANREAVSMDGNGATIPIAYDSLCASLAWSGGY